MNSKTSNGRSSMLAGGTPLAVLGLQYVVLGVVNEGSGISGGREAPDRRQGTSMAAITGGFILFMSPD